MYRISRSGEMVVVGRSEFALLEVRALWITCMCPVWRQSAIGRVASRRHTVLEGGAFLIAKASRTGRLTIPPFYLCRKLDNGSLPLYFSE
jgi:hypothetical protein